MILTVEPDQVIGAAGQWDGDLSGFDAPTLSVSGNSATHQAAQYAITAAGADTKALQDGLGQTATDARNAADTYGQQERESAGDLDGQGGYYDKNGKWWPTYDQAWCANDGTPWPECWAYSTAGAKIGSAGGAAASPAGIGLPPADQTPIDHRADNISAVPASTSAAQRIELAARELKPNDMCLERPDDCGRHDNHPGYHMSPDQIDAAVEHQLEELLPEIGE